jgi:hypothetical protein
MCGTCGCGLAPFEQTFCPDEQILLVSLQHQCGPLERSNCELMSIGLL